MSYHTEYVEAGHVGVELIGRKQWNRDHEEVPWFSPILKGRKILTISGDSVLAVEGTREELQEFAGQILEAVGLPIQIPSPVITKPRDLIQGVLGLHYGETVLLDGLVCHCGELVRNQVGLRRHTADKIMEVIAP